MFYVMNRGLSKNFYAHVCKIWHFFVKRNVRNARYGRNGRKGRNGRNRRDGGNGRKERKGSTSWT